MKYLMSYEAIERTPKVGDYIFYELPFHMSYFKPPDIEDFGKQIAKVVEISDDIDDIEFYLVENVCYTEKDKYNWKQILNLVPFDVDYIRVSKSDIYEISTSLKNLEMKIQMNKYNI